MKLILTVMAVFFAGVFSYAQEILPPETMGDASKFLTQLIESLLKGEYQIAGGILIMVLMVAVRQYALPKWKLSTDIMPIVTMVLASVSFAGLSISSGVPIKEALVSGVTTGLLAAGSWDIIGKMLAKKLMGDKLAK